MKTISTTKNIKTKFHGVNSLIVLFEILNTTKNYQFIHYNFALLLF